MFKRIFILFFFVGLFSSVKAQLPSSYVFTVEIANYSQTHLYGTIFSGGVQCSQGFEIQHCYDSLFFSNVITTVYSSSGPCGGFNADVSFDTYHTPSDISKKSYYRMFFPPSGYGPVKVADYTKVFGEYKLYPQPMHSSARLEFSNDAGKEYYLEISHPLGLSMYFFVGNVNNYWDIYASWFPQTGIYPFRIIAADGSKVIKGKINVQKL